MQAILDWLKQHKISVVSFSGAWMTLVGVYATSSDFHLLVATVYNSFPAWLRLAVIGLAPVVAAFVSPKKGTS